MTAPVILALFAVLLASVSVCISLAMVIISERGVRRGR